MFQAFELADLSCLSMPPTSDDERILASTPHSIDFSFSGHDGTLIERDGGRVQNRRVPPNSGRAVGGEAFAWVRVDEPYECVQITAYEALRREVAAELWAEDAADLAEIWSQNDTALWWAAALRASTHVPWITDGSTG